MGSSDILVSLRPLHERVTDDLLRRIEGGTYAAGAMIPTEEALCRAYGVSRITVRRALAVLVQMGLVTRRRGVGTVVTGRAADRREFHLVGFLDDTLAFDHQVLSDAAEAAPGRVAAALGIEPGTPVRHICSLVHRDGAPFTLTHAYTVDLPERRVSAADYGDRVPSAEALGRRLGQRIVRAEQELDAVSADGFAAERLGVARHTALMRAQRTYYSAGEQPIQHLVVLYRPDCYRFVVDMVPRSGTTAFQALPGQQRVEERT